MELAEYERMFDLEDRHWWFQSRLALVHRILARHEPKGSGGPTRLLDIGCGTGMFLEREGPGRRVVGLDFSPEALRFTKRRGVGPLVCGDSQALPFLDGRFDVVTAFDLIEHVDRDAQLVAETHRVLRPGGILLATVPAHPSLWSSHDVALHHKRRYRRAEFERLFDPARWATRRMTYIFAGIYPLAALVRAGRGFAPAGRRDARADTNLTPGWIDGALRAYHALEASWISRFDAPFGLSLLTVREKRRESRPNA